MYNKHVTFDTKGIFNTNRKADGSVDRPQCLISTQFVFA